MPMGSLCGGSGCHRPSGLRAGATRSSGYAGSSSTLSSRTGTQERQQGGIDLLGVGEVRGVGRAGHLDEAGAP